MPRPLVHYRGYTLALHLPSIRVSHERRFHSNHTAVLALLIRAGGRAYRGWLAAS